MRIGLDFDNTIINYENVFHETAVSYGYINDNDLLPPNTKKQNVKDFLIKKNQENVWTEIQGLVYGKAIKLAKPYKNIDSFLQYLIEENHVYYIVSHKTKYPFIGEKIDLHLSASMWIADNLTRFFDQNIYFETTIESKIKKIADLDLDFYIDDLEQILTHNDFPKNTKKILFNQTCSDTKNFFYVAHDWDSIFKLFNKIK